MIYLSLESNPFEFAVVAALRAKQLMAGCVPRVLPASKFTSTASLEVREGKVVRVPIVPPSLIPAIGGEAIQDGAAAVARPVGL